jgi:5'(3')-deoxyribonucleotidase
VKPKVFLDMDGVIAAFERQAQAYFGIEDPYLDESNLGKFNVYSEHPRFNWDALEYDFWRGIPPTPEANELVHLLEATFGAENITLLSAPTFNVGCMPGKKDWIGAHFPQFLRRYLFGNAKQFCASPQSLLIDDKDENVDRFIDAGGAAILFPRPWNRNHHMAAQPMRWGIEDAIRDQWRHFANCGSFWRP